MGTLILAQSGFLCILESHVPVPPLHRSAREIKISSFFSSIIFSTNTYVCRVGYFAYQNGDIAVAAVLTLISLNLLLHPV